jgi:hypothetical protein
VSSAWRDARPRFGGAQAGRDTFPEEFRVEIFRRRIAGTPAAASGLRRARSAVVAKVEDAGRAAASFFAVASTRRTGKGGVDARRRRTPAEGAPNGGGPGLRGPGGRSELRARRGLGAFLDVRVRSESTNSTRLELGLVTDTPAVGHGGGAMPARASSSGERFPPIAQEGGDVGVGRYPSRNPIACEPTNRRRSADDRSELARGGLVRSSSARRMDRAETGPALPPPAISHSPRAVMPARGTLRPL